MRLRVSCFHVRLRLRINIMTIGTVKFYNDQKGFGFIALLERGVRRGV